ncbi:MAG: hypothetical protein JSR36_00730 [Proteobacteria bacterium]|nr:hypothetical protein [Pseudomonadota bacterium]
MKQPAKTQNDTGFLNAEAAHRYAQEILQESLTMLAQTGHSPVALLRMCEAICSRLKEPEAPFDPDAAPYVMALPHVIAHWYSDTDLRGPHSQPRRLPLRARGRGPSLETLIRRVFPTEDLDRVVESLLRASAIEQHGRLYAPVERYVSLKQDAWSMSIHALMSAAGLLRTIRHNLSTDDASATFLERTVRNPRIPVSALGEVHSHLKRHIGPILWNFDGYFRSLEVEAGSEPTTSVSIAVCVFEDPMVTGAVVGSAAKSTTPPRRGPAPRGQRRGRRS